MNNKNYNAGCYSVSEIIKRSKQEQLQKEVNQFIGFIMLFALAVYLSACSVKFEVGYHGETAKDDKTYTQGNKK